jgi:hypothetical protein
MYVSLQLTIHDTSYLNLDVVAHASRITLSHHMPINVPTAVAQAFFMDYT